MWCMADEGDRAPLEDHPDPARRPRGWRVLVVIAVILVVALVAMLLAGVSLFGPQVPTPSPAAASPAGTIVRLIGT